MQSGQCAIRNFMRINSMKSAVLVWGRNARESDRKFLFGDGEVRVEATYMYLGFELTTQGTETFGRHYANKNAAAQRAGREICGFDKRMGDVAAKHQCILYLSLVDPHLTHGCEVVLDHAKACSSELEKTQKAFVRRVLGLGKKSVTTVLYTETGLEPIRWRRLLLAVEFVCYLVQLHEGHIVKAALREAVKGDIEGQRTWMTELRWVTSHWRPANSRRLPESPGVAACNAPGCVDGQYQGSDG